MHNSFFVWKRKSFPWLHCNGFLLFNNQCEIVRNSPKAPGFYTAF